MTVVSHEWKRDEPSEWAILVHGGAGDVPEDRRPLHVAGCERAARAGAEILEKGGSALDAVQQAVEVLENDPLFNAGTGACLDIEGNIELDASIMTGDLRFGGVCALPPFKNPIAIARKVMESTRHILLAGEGAARFALEAGFERADPKAMITEQARRKLAKAVEERSRASQASRSSTSGGTVGAVARDAKGRVAVATSTGGMVAKLPGRVGDSPIPGAGTYADDGRGACSTTGHGEAMMRVCLAKTIIDTQDPAASLEIMRTRTGERGGAILARHDGSLALARTTETMSWAAETADGSRASGC